MSADMVAQFVTCRSPVFDKKRVSTNAHDVEIARIRRWTVVIVSGIGAIGTVASALIGAVTR